MHIQVKYLAGLPVHFLSVFLLITMYAGAWDIARPLGIVPLALILVFIAFVIGLSPTKIKLVGIYRPYLFFFLIICFYFFASYANLLDIDDKMFFEKGFILRQGVGFFVFPLIAMFFTLLFYYNSWLFASRGIIIWLIVTCYLLASVLGFLFSNFYSNPWENFAFYTLNNAELIIVFLSVFLIFHFTKSKLIQFSLLTLLLLVTTSSQSSIALILAIVFLFFPSKLVLTGFVLALSVAVPLSLLFPLELFELDPNTGLRSMFWLSGLQDFIHTWGVGIGFGTEALQAKYYALYRELAILDVDSQFERFMTTGMHNTFIDLLQRTGIPGFVAFCWIIFSVISGLTKHQLSSFDAWVVCVLALSLSVNVALSINFIFGTCLLIGWLQARLLVINERESPAK